MLQAGMNIVDIGIVKTEGHDVYRFTWDLYGDSYEIDEERNMARPGVSCGFWSRLTELLSLI
jgi:hypothetical protein